MSYQPAGGIYSNQPGYGTAGPPAGAYCGAPPQGPPAGAYPPTYQQPSQTTVYVYEDGRRSQADEDVRLAQDCCLLACCWTLLCCCFMGNN